jgi:hypothetical protein
MAPSERGVWKKDASAEAVFMAITFHITGALREFTAGHSRVQIEHSPKTLAEALSALWTTFQFGPGFQVSASARVGNSI